VMVQRAHEGSSGMTTAAGRWARTVDAKVTTARAAHTTRRCMMGSDRELKLAGDRRERAVRLL